MSRHTLGAVLIVALPAILFSAHASAHGFAGDRFFPATIQTDDPFVADEGSLPTLTRNPTDVTGTQSYSVEADLSKRITPSIDITLHDQWNYFQHKGAPPNYGFSDLTTGVQYQLFINGPHEAMALAGLSATWGHTGRVNGGQADDHTTLSPTLDFGKGLGDLPESLSLIRPFAITANLSVNFPTKVNSNGALNQDIFNAGVAIEYSLEYLQHHVMDVGLSAPFDRLISLVEITSATPLNRGVNLGTTNNLGNATTGVIAPGFIWAGQYYQIAAEAIVPYGQGQGHGIGGLVQLHFFLDDLFPKSIGRPLLGY